MYRRCLHNSITGWLTYVQRLIMAADGNGATSRLYAFCEADIQVSKGLKNYTGYQVYPKTSWNYTLELSYAEDAQLLETLGVKPQS